MWPEDEGKGLLVLELSRLMHMLICMHGLHTAATAYYQQTQTVETRITQSVFNIA
jgi:hypothetical protein